MKSDNRMVVKKLLQKDGMSCNEMDSPRRKMVQTTEGLYRAVGEAGLWTIIHHSKPSGFV